MPLFTIPSFTIDESKLPQIARGLSPITWAKFYKVILKEHVQSELHEFDNLSTMVMHEHNNAIVYHFVDMQFENSLPLYLFIDIDKSVKHIRFFRDFTQLSNGWMLYFNSKSSIIFRNPVYTVSQGFTKLLDNFPYRKVNFFVGISSLVEVMKHTTSTNFVEILPILEMKSQKLEEVSYFKH